MNTTDSPDSQSEAVLLPETYTIRYSRLALAAIALFALCAIVTLSQYVIALFAVEAFVFAILVWMLRNQTTLTADSLQLRTTFSSRTLPWSQLAGVRIRKHGWVRARLIDGGEVGLPAVGFDRLRELAVASHGHIPDPGA